MTQAALETLCVVAYRQPVTRMEIETLRGVQCDRAVATLVAYGLIQEVGRRDTIGRPILYGTTEEFLRHFGLSAWNSCRRWKTSAPWKGRNAGKKNGKERPKLATRAKAARSAAKKKGGANRRPQATLRHRGAGADRPWPVCGPVHLHRPHGRGGGGGQGLPPGLVRLAAWAMPLFLLVSGWLTLIAWDRKINAGKLALTLGLFLFLNPVLASILAQLHPFLRPGGGGLWQVPAGLLRPWQEDRPRHGAWLGGCCAIPPSGCWASRGAMCSRCWV